MDKKEKINVYYADNVFSLESLILKVDYILLISSIVILYNIELSVTYKQWFLVCIIALFIVFNEIKYFFIKPNAELIVSIDRIDFVYLNTITSYTQIETLILIQMHYYFSNKAPYTIDITPIDGYTLKLILVPYKFLDIKKVVEKKIIPMLEILKKGNYVKRLLI